jgi:hypothetical protein
MRMLVWLAALVATAFLGGSAASAQAFAECTEANFLAWFDDALGPQPCRLVFRTDIATARGASELAVIRLGTDAAGDDAAWAALTEHAATTIGRGLDEVGTARLPRFVTVLLRSRTEARDFDPGPGVSEGLVHAHVTGVEPANDECFVSFFKGDRDISREEFARSLAHEVFHCAQQETWPGPARASHAGWWLEGSAEYFSNLVQQGFGSRAEDLYGGFEELSRERSLVDLWYENVVFFYWLHGRGGPMEVGRFLEGMTPGAGRGAQLGALSRLAPQDAWVDFVEAYLDGQITDLTGRAIAPLPLPTGERTFASSGALPLPARGYAIPRWIARFAEGKVYETSIEATGGAPTSRAKKYGSDDPWGEMPERVDACAEEKVYLVYSVTTEGTAEARLEVETEEDRTGGRCCLVGEWKPTAEALQGLSDFGMRYGGPPVAMAGGQLSCGYEGGDWRLTFREDGTGAISFDGYENQCTVRGRGGRMAVISRREGTTEFSWDVTGEGAGRLGFTGHDMSQQLLFKVGPMVQDLSGAYPGPSTEANGIAFACEGDSLSIQGVFDLLQNQAEHVRVEAVP